MTDLSSPRGLSGRPLIRTNRDGVLSLPVSTFHHRERQVTPCCTACLQRVNTGTRKNEKNFLHYLSLKIFGCLDIRVRRPVIKDRSLVVWTPE